MFSVVVFVAHLMCMCMCRKKTMYATSFLRSYLFFISHKQNGQKEEEKQKKKKWQIFTEILRCFDIFLLLFYFGFHSLFLLLLFVYLCVLFCFVCFEIFGFQYFSHILWTFEIVEIAQFNEKFGYAHTRVHIVFRLYVDKGLLWFFFRLRFFFVIIEKLTWLFRLNFRSTSQRHASEKKGTKNIRMRDHHWKYQKKAIARLPSIIFHFGPTLIAIDFIKCAKWSIS